MYESITLQSKPKERVKEDITNVRLLTFTPNHIHNYFTGIWGGGGGLDVQYLYQYSLNLFC